MSFGRPVLPPEVGALNDAPITSGSESDGSEESGSNPAGTVVRPGASDGSTPSTREGVARSMISLRSAAGSRDESGWGVDPRLRDGTSAVKNTIPVGHARVDIEIAHA